MRTRPIIWLAAALVAMAQASAAIPAQPRPSVTSKASAQVTAMAQPRRLPSVIDSTVDVARRMLSPFRLNVARTFRIDQAVLVIDGGRVMAIEPGTIKAEGTAKVGGFELCPPIKKELGDLPGSISFGEGLRLHTPPPGKQPASTPPTT